MILTAQDIRELNLFKYYRLVRKWACKTYNITDADLELLIYLDCKGRFTRNDFINALIPRFSTIFIKALTTLLNSNVVFRFGTIMPLGVMQRIDFSNSS